ncbi:MAG: transposase [Pyrinomonadaceae bacterium]
MSKHRELYLESSTARSNFSQTPCGFLPYQIHLRLVVALISSRVKRSNVGSFHHISEKHIDCYLDEFGFR